ncbi:MAG: sialate O-acetylesterase [Mariniphaga sp.]
MKILFLVITTLFLSFSGFAQNEKTLLFKDGDRVCFVGNSITHNGEFHSDLFLYYATRFPKEKVSFFNCGISGDVAGGILSRMDSDILVHKPTVAVVMIGMNDVNRNLYTKANEGNLEADQKKAAAIEGYKKNTTKIADIFKNYGSRLILQLPTIYDQTAKIATENLFGVNDALGKCAEHLKSVAPEYQATVIDYYSLLKKINEEGQKKDSAYTIIGADRVHPQSPGHLIMAYQFLKTTGAPKYVSKIVIDARHKNITESTNCQVEIKSSKKKKIQFDCIANALPYPVKKEALPALSLVPFSEDLNQEILQINNLESGDYNLFIDNILINTYHSDLFKDGINLAGDTITPQYRQALQIRALCEDYRAVGGKLRNIAYIEYKNLGDFKGNVNDFEAVKAFLDQKIPQTTHPYIKANLEQYLINKPNQNLFKAQLEEIRNRIYQVNIPVKHSYTIVKINQSIIYKKGLLFLLAGQSNGVGQGDSTKSPNCIPGTSFEFDAAANDFIPLKDPAGKAWKLFNKAGTGSVAPSFAKRMNELTNTPVYMVTAARGGASCNRKAEMSNYDTWDTTGKLFDQSVEKTKMAEAKSGIALSGIIWMQGERDANAILAGQLTAAEYQASLEGLIQRFRAQFGKKLPFFIVQIAYQQDKAPEGCQAVRDAQEAVAKKMKRVYIAYGETGEFAKRKWFKDIVHYNQEALNDIGTKVAENINKLNIR